MRQLSNHQSSFTNRIIHSETLFFWRNWRSPYRSLYVITLALLLVSLVLVAVAAIRGIEGVLYWQTQSELQAVPLTLDSFAKGLFNFSVEATSYAITEQFVPSDMQINRMAVYLYSGLLFLSVILLLSVVTTLPRLWYVGSMAVFILWLASCKLDLLQVFGDTGNLFFIASVTLIVPVSYYLHAFRSGFPFGQRLLIFALLLVLLTGVAALFSRNTLPLLTTLSYGSIVPMALSALFILLVSPEIMRSFLFLVSQSGSPNSLLHFTLLTLIYLVNLVLRYLHNIEYIDWNILYVNAFFILAISILLGIWGFRKRNILFAHILTEPFTSLLYAGLGTLTLATMGFAFATGNDPMVDMFEDTILYTHIGMGIAFFFYVLINFRQPMQQGLAVYKVVFQPKQFPMSYTWGLTAVILFAFMLQVSMLPFYRGVAAYHNQLGDLYTLQRNDVLAEQYYQLAHTYAYNNHKSNYSAASVALRQDDPVKAAEYLRTALKNNPYPYTYARLSNLYLQEDLLFDAMFTLKDGVKAFPENGEMLNNLALLYNRSNIRDSAFYYYQLAAEHTEQTEVPQTNLLAFWIKNPTLTNTDSLFQTTAPSGAISLENNRLMLANVIGKTDQQAPPAFWQQDSVFTVEKFAYAFNYLLNHKDQGDSTVVKQLEKFQSDGRNSFFYDDLELAKSCLHYYGINRSRGLEGLNGLRAGSEQRGAYFNKILGLWYLQNDAYRIAANFFENAVRAGDSTMRMNQAIALAEAGNWNAAREICRQEGLNPDVGVRTVARRLGAVIQALQSSKTDSTAQLDDAGKVLLVRLNKSNPPATLPLIEDKAYQLIGLVELAKNHLAKNQIIQAEEAYRIAAQMQMDSPLLREMALELMAAKKQYSELLKALGEPIPTDAAQTKKPYWEALSYENTGKIPLAGKLYGQALRRLPLDEQVVIAAAQFYHNKQKNPDRAYGVLVDAVRLNPYAPANYKAYIMQALEMQLFDYATKGMEELQTITTPADYQAFAPQYEAKRTAVEKRTGDWQ